MTDPISQACRKIGTRPASTLSNGELLERANAYIHLIDLLDARGIDRKAERKAADRLFPIMARRLEGDFSLSDRIALLEAFHDLLFSGSFVDFARTPRWSEYFKNRLEYILTEVSNTPGLTPLYHLRLLLLTSETASDDEYYRYSKEIAGIFEKCCWNDNLPSEDRLIWLIAWMKANSLFEYYRNTDTWLIRIRQIIKTTDPHKLSKTGKLLFEQLLTLIKSEEAYWSFA